MTCPGYMASECSYNFLAFHIFFPNQQTNSEADKNKKKTRIKVWKLNRTYCTFPIFFYWSYFPLLPRGITSCPSFIFLTNSTQTSKSRLYILRAPPLPLLQPHSPVGALNPPQKNVNNTFLSGSSGPSTLRSSE